MNQNQQRRRLRKMALERSTVKIVNQAHPKALPQKRLGILAERSHGGYFRNGRFYFL